MSRDDDNYSIDYQIAFPARSRNRKSKAAQPRAAKPLPHQLRYSAKKRQLIAARDQARIESPKSACRPDPDDRPRKSMTRSAKELMCDYPEITVDQLMLKLERLGYQPAPIPIATIRREFIDSIKVAHEMGYIKILD